MERRRDRSDYVKELRRKDVVLELSAVWSGEYAYFAQ
jgi:hypothetical protein